MTTIRPQSHSRRRGRTRATNQPRCHLSVASRPLSSHRLAGGCSHRNLCRPCRMNGAALHPAQPAAAPHRLHHHRQGQRATVAAVASLLLASNLPPLLRASSQLALLVWKRFKRSTLTISARASAAPARPAAREDDPTPLAASAAGTRRQRPLRLRSDERDARMQLQVPSTTSSLRAQPNQLLLLLPPAARRWAPSRWFLWAAAQPPAATAVRIRA